MPRIWFWQLKQSGEGSSGLLMTEKTLVPSALGVSSDNRVTKLDTTPTVQLKQFFGGWSLNSKLSHKSFDHGSNPGQTGCGGIFRDIRGLDVAGFYYSNGEATSLEVGAYGLLRGFKMKIDRAYLAMEIEIKSLSLFNMVQASEKPGPLQNEPILDQLIKHVEMEKMVPPKNQSLSSIPVSVAQKIGKDAFVDIEIPFMHPSSMQNQPRQKGGICELI
ncbi:hypothetical protein ACH5RR_015669 [Cinchona calisaya]|uniref:RNase H type-1 domain-containing protein n=1 Tax=Cinchona calisaya TaxID=153742 RepID=A0ABD2ZWY0_9GENT